MFKSFRKYLTLFVAGLALAVVSVAVPVTVLAAEPNIDQGLQCGSDFQLQTSGGCQGGVDEGSTRLSNLVTSIVNIFSLVVGVVSVIMIIYGGFRYVTSGGESSNVTTAKNTIIYAIVGLIVVALAQFIVQFVVGKVTAP